MRTMALANFTRGFKTQAWVAFFLSASLFAIPLSSTAKSVFIVITLSLILLSPIYRRDLLHAFLKPWGISAVCFFLLALVACMWSPATASEKWWEIEKYSKLLYLPILAVGFRDEAARRFGLYGFLLAMIITVIASILFFTGVLVSATVEAGGLFRNHIMTGYMMAFAAYLSGLLCLQQRGKTRLCYGLLVVLFSYYVFFINNGRTGYVIYLLLMGLLMVQCFSWRQAFMGIVILCSLFTLSYYQSPVMRVAVESAVSECQHYTKNEKDTSIGFRLQFHDYAQRLFMQHPWIGNGTASFTHIYKNEKPFPGWTHNLLEPHSQYWLVASEYGVLGCLALAFFFGSLLMSSLRLKQLRPLALAVLLPFFVGNLSDSLLFYSGTGYFFILFMALCLGEQKRTTY